MSREWFDLGGGHVGDLRPLARLFGRWLPVLDARKTLFLACWLEYHEDLKAAARFVARVIAEDRQRSREVTLGWLRHHYAGMDRVHACAIRESPMLRLMGGQ